MKALSMKQPVPELILQKKKTIETRTWNTKFRGEFYLHASQSTIPRLLEEFNLNINKIPQGAIVGKATITEIKTYNTLEEFNKDKDKHLSSKPIKLPTYGYILENIERLETPIPWKGQLNFFDIELKEKQQKLIKVNL